jgi:Spy/CpxP family protein refolding chaperone
VFRTAKVGLTAVALAGSALAFTAGPAQAVTDYPSCAAMHHVWKHGVARTEAAADHQERTHHFRPAVKPAVYRVNNESDADHDGTACEVSR